MTEQRVSSRYARAILNIATDAGQAESVMKDMKQIEGIIDGSRDLLNLVRTPVVQFWKKRAIFHEIFEPFVSKLTLDFMMLLTDKNREALLPDIIVQYEKQYNKMHDLLPVEITSAVELRDESKARLVKKLEDYTKKKIIPRFKTDMSLKGGMIVRIDDWVFDASILNQLAVLYNKLIKNEAI